MKNKRLFIVILLLCIFIVFGISQDTQRKVPSTASIAPIRSWADVQTVVDNYVQSHKKYRTQILLKESMLDSKFKTMPTLESFERVTNLLKQKYADTNEHTKRINQQFKELRVGIYSKEYASFPRSDNSGNHIQRIALVIWEERNHPKYGKVNFLYENQVDVVFISALRYPEPLLAARLYHELGHAHKDRFAFETKNSVAAEEVEMHTIEGEVLNRATNSQFSALVNRVIDRIPMPPSFEQWRDKVITHITREDLEQLDKITGTDHLSYRVAKSSIAAFLIHLGFQMIERFFPAQEQLQQKERYYNSMPHIHELITKEK